MDEMTSAIETLDFEMPSVETAHGVVGEVLNVSGDITLAGKIAERLAYESDGACLYDRLLDKLNGAAALAGGPSAQELQAIRDREQEHARLLTEALAQIAAENMPVPRASAAGGVDSRLSALLSDSRTNLGQCLYMLIVRGLTGREGWGVLRGLAEETGRRDLAERFYRAEKEQEQHLSSVRGWLAANARAEADLLVPEAANLRKGHDDLRMEG